MHVPEFLRSHMVMGARNSDVVLESKFARPYLLTVGGTHAPRHASRAVFGALAEHKLRSARVPTGAAEAALPNGKHTRAPCANCPGEVLRQGEGYGLIAWMR